MQVAHFAYHFELRCHLLPFHTVRHILPAIEHELKTSMLTVEELADKLGLMPSGEETRRLWNTAKQNLLKYIACPDAYERRSLHDEICDVGRHLTVELNAFLPRSLSGLIPYLNVVQAVTGITATGEMPSLSGIESYISAVRIHFHPTFTRDFIQASDDVCSIMRTAQTRACTEDEIARVFSLSSWLSDNFLSAFIPEAHNITNYVAASVESQSAIQLESFLHETFQETHELVEPVNSDNELDGEENQNASEKFALEESEKKYSAISDESKSPVIHESREKVSGEEVSGEMLDYEFPFLANLDTFRIDKMQRFLPTVRKKGKLGLLREHLAQLAGCTSGDLQVLRQSIEELHAAQCSDIPVIFLALEQARVEKQQEVEKAERILLCLKAAMRMTNVCRCLHEIETNDVMQFLRMTLDCSKGSRDLLRSLRCVVEL